MEARSIERPGNDQDPEHGAGTGDSVSPADAPRNDALRSWLARGIHTAGIDPRRLGGHGDARRVLGGDRHSPSRAAGSWRELASALQRHTLHSALTRLNATERQVVVLAFLEGLTNRQIAVTLGVSVSTVRRRLWRGLDHLDDYVRRTGTWVSSILVVGLVFVIDRWARLGRLVSDAAAAELPHKVAATVAVGAVAAAGFGVAAASSHSLIARQGTAPATASQIHSFPGVTNSSLPRASLTPDTAARITTSAAGPETATTAASKAAKPVSDANHEGSGQGDNKPPAVTDSHPH
ncbi:MAG TPA: sigma-70 family RNA polymerase sigma factor [Candidatus Dormibacteraeota bacterium]|nr:sigma-70 family RNA polymerase sigma factor [Candidatus Dormibacteraeota bacterium]